MLTTLAVLMVVGMPSSIQQAVQLPGGWASPIAGNRMVTAAHVVAMYSDGIVPYMDSKGNKGVSKITCIDLVNDVAVLQHDNSSLMTFFVTSNMPEIQSEVFWRAYLTGGKPTIARGYYLGLDAANDMNIDGWIAQGSSGSPVVNAKGELVGFMDASGNQNDSDSDQDIARLFAKTSFRSLGYAKPLNVGKCKVVK